MKKDNRIKGWKGFQRQDDGTLHAVIGMYKYQVGHRYHYKGKLVPCQSGFHFCTNPLGVFQYYQPDMERACFGEVTAGGAMLKCKAGSKMVAEEIAVTEEPMDTVKYIEALMRRAAEDDKWHVKRTGKVVASCQDARLVLSECVNRVAVAAGCESAAVSTGTGGVAVALQSNSVALAEYQQSVAVATALHSMAVTRGDHSVALGGTRYGIGGHARAEGAASVAYAGHAFATNKHSVALGTSEARAGDHGVATFMPGSFTGKGSAGKFGVVIATGDFDELSGDLGCLLVFWHHELLKDGRIKRIGHDVVMVDGENLKPGEVVCRKMPDNKLHVVDIADGGRCSWGREIRAQSFLRDTENEEYKDMKHND